jgi:SAM-dependent methyltransferase
MQPSPALLPRRPPTLLRSALTFFGELYFRTTLPHLTPATTAKEAAFLARVLAHVRPGAIADLGCGHGRHAAPLSAQLSRPVIGIELDPYALERRERGFPAVQADFFALPFRDGALAAAYAWYSSLFSFSDEREPLLHRELARCIAADGLLIAQTVPFERAAAEPESSYETTLPDGSHVFEQVRFDPRTRRDEGFRRLTLPDGRELSAHFFVRYHPLEELTALLARAGFQVRAVHGDLDGGPLTAHSTDLIVIAERR